MNKRPILIAFILAGVTNSTQVFSASPNNFVFQAGTGALSYTFFNLSPNTWTIQPAGANSNSNAPLGSPALAQGWDNLPGTVGFFNNLAISGSCNNPNSQAQLNPIFYDLADPIVPSTDPLSIDPGQQNVANPLEYSTSYSQNENPPAIGDSWILTNAPNSANFVMANMASSGNAFVSGQAELTTNELAAAYPYCSQWGQAWYNGSINPPSPPSSSESGYYGLSAGFVNQTMNFNGVYGTTPGLINTGGLWSGLINNTVVQTNESPQAVNALNLAMYPVNMSNYVVQDTHTYYLNAYNCVMCENITAANTTSSPIYGGHFTVALGDPFVVNSYAAKILWSIVSGVQYSVGPDSLDIDDLKFLTSVASSVFVPGSQNSDYATWLMGSPKVAEGVMSQLNANAKVPVTKETIWGKVFSQAATIAIDSTVAAIAVTTGDPDLALQTKIGENSTALYAQGFTDSITNAIAVNNTTTISAGPPIATNAPVVINDTYSAGNLLGMLLTNTIMQAEVNNSLATGASNPSNFAIWSNYSINTDDLCTSIQISANLMSSVCGPTSGTAPVYNNVLSTYPYSNPVTGTSAAGPFTPLNAQLNIWDAILTGSDITAVDGYLQLQNPSIPAFTPPTQVVNDTGTTPIAAPGVASVNVTFNAPTGMLNVASYSTDPNSGTSGNNKPTEAPAFNMVIGSAPMAKQGIVFSAPTFGGNGNSSWSYASNTGILTVYGYNGTSAQDPQDPAGEVFSNGVQSINLNACLPNSSVTLTLNPNPDSFNQSDAAGVLSCSYTGVTSISSGTYPKPKIMPTIAAIVTPVASPSTITSICNPYNGCTTTLPPLAPTLSPANALAYDMNTGLLTVSGFGANTVNGLQTGVFLNGTQVLDMTTCPTNNVNLIIDPATQIAGAITAYGYLTCASSPSLPYSACTNDAQATGGVIVGIKTPPALPASGGSVTAATFTLGCACIPSYVQGPTSAINSIGGVLVGATNVNISGSCGS